ncbi:MAG: DUF4115 domain-containing protein [Micavibrio sp.]|nr:DUF4115 domain-containing protein [Micavibrio sp.]
MTEEKEKKRKRAHGEPEQSASAQNMKVGAWLKQTRLARAIELEEVSAAIHVRVAQLKAIEENHIESLPGMTYAVGFVKSYANYLKLDANDVLARFRAENGAAARPQLHAPEAFVESKMPDPLMLGIAGFCVVLLIAAWAVFSGGDDSDKKIASNIPAAPTVAETTTLLTPSVAPVSAAMAPATTTAPVAGTATLATGTAPAGHAAATVPPAGTVAAAPAAGALPDANAQVADGMVISALPRPSPKPTDAADAPAASTGINWDTPAADTADNSVINVGRGRSRVMLRANEASWVQISDAAQHVLLKKVLRAGDQFFVPGTATTLVTSNAGGFDVFVDGSKVQQLGDRGEILRGVSLDPESLSRTRKNARHYE